MASGAVAHDVQQCGLRLAGCRIDQVQNRPLRLADNRGVGRLGKTAYRRRVPVIAPRHAARLVHALLDDRPFPIPRDDEIVQVDLEAVADGVVIDARREAAVAHQRFAIQAVLVRHTAEFGRGVSRVPSAAAADEDAEFAGPWIQSAFERAHYRGGDAGRMPVHAHYAAKGLEPEGVAEPAEEFGAAVLQQDAFRDRCAQRRHALGQPGGHMAAMQRQIGMARALHPGFSLPLQLIQMRVRMVPGTCSSLRRIDTVSARSSVSTSITT